MSLRDPELDIRSTLDKLNKAISLLKNSQLFL